MRFVLLAGALLAMPATAQTIGETPSQEDRRAIVAAVGDRLRDGESARWRWPEYRNEVVYCGFVNARNAFGAYAGFEQFHILGTRMNSGRYWVSRISLRGDGLDEAAISRLCLRAGYRNALPAQ